MIHGRLLDAIETKLIRALRDHPGSRRRELRALTGLNTGQVRLGLESLIAAAFVSSGGTSQIFSLTESGREHFQTFVGPEPVQPAKPEPPSLHQGILF